MAGTGRKWLIGCGVGCGGIILLSIILTVVGSLVMMRPFNEAIDDQKELIAAYGEREEYMPPVETITRGQLKRFIKVRRSLMVHCDDFEKLLSAFEGMEELDKGGEDPSTGEALKAVGKVMGSAMSLPRLIGEVSVTRNAALLDADMGLGEYTWIYSLVYHSWLGHPPNQDIESSRGTTYSDRELDVIHQLLKNQVQVLRDAGRPEEAEIWESESKRVIRSDDRIPFSRGGFPAELATTLAPYRSELEGLYCPPMSAFELTKIRKKGLSIQAD